MSNASPKHPRLTNPTNVGSDRLRGAVACELLS